MLLILRVLRGDPGSNLTAVTYNNNVYAYLCELQYFSYFGGNPLAVTAVSSVIDIIVWQKLQENAKQTGAYLSEQLQELKQYEFVGDVRGVGLFQGIDIVRSKESKE